MKSLSEQWKAKKKELNDFFTPEDLVLHVKKHIDSQITITEIADYTGGGGALLKPFQSKKVYNELLKEYFDGTPDYDIKTNEDFLSDYPFKSAQVVFLNPPFESRQKIGVRMACKGYDLAKEYYALIYSPSLRYVQRFESEREYLTKDKHLYRLEEIPAKTFTETDIPVIVLYFDKRKTFDEVEVIKGSYKENRKLEDVWENIIEPANEPEPQESIEDINIRILQQNIKIHKCTIEMYEHRKESWGDLSEAEEKYLSELKKLDLDFDIK